jgi:hypothetical protein
MGLLDTVGFQKIHDIKFSNHAWDKIAYVYFRHP